MQTTILSAMPTWVDVEPTDIVVSYTGLPISYDAKNIINFAKVAEYVHPVFEFYDEIDTETLIQMANAQPDESDKENDDLMGFEESETEDMRELGDFVDDYNEEKDLQMEAKE